METAEGMERPYLKGYTTVPHDIFGQRQTVADSACCLLTLGSPELTTC